MKKIVMSTIATPDRRVAPGRVSTRLKSTCSGTTSGLPSASVPTSVLSVKSSW